MKTISSEAYLAFDGTKFFDRDACRKYEQDGVLKPIAAKLAAKLTRYIPGAGIVGFDYRPEEHEIRQFLRENREEMLAILQGMTP